MANTDTALIREELLARINEKMKQLDSIRPVPADALARLHEEMRLVHTYHSNAIEGNTLTLQETRPVLEEGLTIGGKSLRERLEASNNAKAYDRMEELVKKKYAIDHVTIQEIHEIVSIGILEDAGRYRTRNVRIADAVKIPPD